jgi:hypothetical protein
VSGHYHEPYEVHGLNETCHETREALASLGEELGAALERVAELENKLDDALTRFWAHVGTVPGGI